MKRKEISYKIHPEFTGKAPILVEDDEGEWLLIDWDFCAVENCKNRVYIDSIYCFPHTEENKKSI